MYSENTEATVTKIDKSPKGYYSAQKVQKNVTGDSDEACVTEWVKVNHNKELNNEDIISDKLKSELLSIGTTCTSALYRALSSTKKHAAISAKRALKNAAGQTKKLAVSGAASVIAAVILVSVVFGTCSLACRVKLGDKEIGTLPSKQVYYEILSDVKEEVLDAAAIDFEPSGELNVSTVLVGKGQFSEPGDVKERLKSTSSEMIPAWGITIDDKTVVALASKDDALSLLEEYKQQFAQDGAFLSFHSRVEVSNQFVPVKILKNREDALAFLNSGRDCSLLVQATIEAEGEESVPFEVEQKYDDSKYIGDNEIVQQGKDGLRYIKYYSVKVNGEEIERTVLSEEIISQPIKQIELIGTKEPPSPTGTGEFAQPTSGTLTSEFGERWNREHCGIDIGASVGTMIYASDNGTVTYSQYNDGGYGYLVKIDHANGYETYYAHCSELLVDEGDVVAKGDPIAKVGNTGRSTGPHLHFEVRKNNEPQNPLKYIK